MKIDLAIFRGVFFVQVAASWFFLFSWAILLIGSLQWMREPLGVYVAVTAWGMLYASHTISRDCGDTMDEIKKILKKDKK